MIIRQARLNDAAAIAKVHVDSWQSTYLGILPDDYIARQSYEKRKNHWQKSLAMSSGLKTDYFVYVVENSKGVIVGFIDAGRSRNKNFVAWGEIYALYITSGYQRQGIGRNLIQNTALELYKSGFNSMFVWVLADNPAANFYWLLGGQKIAAKQITVSGLKFIEVAYGWQDIQVLTAK